MSDCSVMELRDNESDTSVRLAGGIVVVVVVVVVVAALATDVSIEYPDPDHDNGPEQHTPARSRYVPADNCTDTRAFIPSPAPSSFDATSDPESLYNHNIGSPLDANVRAVNTCPDPTVK